MVEIMTTRSDLNNRSSTGKMSRLDILRPVAQRQK